jgi:16S rRNA (guanine527-N7)-methyltransferase
LSGGAEQVLRDGLRNLNLGLDDRQIAQLLTYVAMIGKWTKVYNLTAVRDPAEMMTHHLLDSLAAVPPLRRQLKQMGLEHGARLLDVGAGAGLPGVVIAICCPTVMVTCVDTVAKKAAFIKQAALELRLANLTGLHQRVEQVAEPFNVICSRAFASLGDFARWSAKALAPGGAWMAMKGKLPTSEIDALDKGIDMFHVEQLTVPGLEAERCIVWMRPVTASTI